MAARADNDSNKLRNVEERLRCSICTGIFTSPRMLPCLHTYCETPCITALVEQAANAVGGKVEIRCPLCCASCVLPEGGVAGLPRNIFVADLVEVMEVKAAAGIGGVGAEKGDEVEEDGGVVCDWCDDGEKKPAAIHCPTCGVFLCDSHQRAHAKAGGTKTHTVVTMEEYKKGAAGDGERVLVARFIFLFSCSIKID